LREYEDVSSTWGNLGAGDWLFAVAPASGTSKANRDRYVALLRKHQAPKALISKYERIRERVGEFLQRCAHEILEAHPDVVGFTSTYSQTWPSAALAYILKELAPGVRIALGGASCEAEMGRATLDAFPWVDVVARGEAEGLSSLEMSSRSRSPEGAHEVLRTLVSRHNVLDTTAVDNIMPAGYYGSPLPRLASEQIDVSIFYEIKVNVTRKRVSLLRDAGVRTAQPGIESLSTPILQVVRGGPYSRYLEPTLRVSGGVGRRL